MTRLQHSDRIVFQAEYFLAVLGWAAHKAENLCLNLQNAG